MSPSLKEPRQWDFKSDGNFNIYPLIKLILRCSVDLFNAFTIGNPLRGHIYLNLVWGGIWGLYKGVKTEATVLWYHITLFVATGFSAVARRVTMCLIDKKAWLGVLFAATCSFPQHALRIHTAKLETARKLKTAKVNRRISRERVTPSHCEQSPPPRRTPADARYDREVYLFLAIFISK